MENKLKTADLISEKRSWSIIILGIWAAYVVITFLSPIQKEVLERYNWSIYQVRIIQATISLPLLAIWFSSLFGILRLNHYANFIKQSKEWYPFRLLVIGLCFLFSGLILPSFISLFGVFNYESLEVQKNVQIINNYLGVSTGLIAFFFILRGSRALLKTIPTRIPTLNLRKILVFSIIAVLSIFYIYMVFDNPYRTTSDDPLVRPNYHVSDFWIFFTIILPYIATWFFGGTAILNIWYFSRNVGGMFYKKGFLMISFGFVSIIALSIGLQFLTQTGGYLSHLSGNSLLLIIYILLALIAFSYGLIAYGARELTKIELL